MNYVSLVPTCNVENMGWPGHEAKLRSLVQQRLVMLQYIPKLDTLSIYHVYSSVIILNLYVIVIIIQISKVKQ